MNYWLLIVFSFSSDRNTAIGAIRISEPLLWLYWFIYIILEYIYGHILIDDLLFFIYFIWV